VQIAENWSRIRGRVEAWQPPRKAGDSGTLTIVVDGVEDVASRDGSLHRNLFADAAGTTVHVTVPASAAEHIDAHNGSTAVVDVRRGQSPDRVFAHPDRITVTL
jgi:hypothetical protein